MTELDEMESFLKSVPVEIRERHRQGLKHRDYVLGYHDSIRQYLQNNIIEARRSLQSSNKTEQLVAMINLFDTIQALRLNDNFEMICLNMIDFHNDANIQTKPPSTTPDTASDNYRNGRQMAETIATYGMQAIQVVSSFLKF